MLEISSVSFGVAVSPILVADENYSSTFRQAASSAAMTFVHDDQIKEVRRELFVNVPLFFGTRHRLVQAKVNLKRTVLATGDGIDRSVNSDELVIARRLVRTVVVVVLRSNDSCAGL